MRVPTLVLHRTGDNTHSRVEEARYLTDHIPGPRLKLLSGEGHLICVDPGPDPRPGRGPGPFGGLRPHQIRRTGAGATPQHDRDDDPDEGRRDAVDDRQPDLDVATAGEDVAHPADQGVHAQPADRVRHDQVRTECGLCYCTPRRCWIRHSGRARCGPSAHDPFAARTPGWVSSLERTGASATASTPRTAERINVTVSIVATASYSCVASSTGAGQQAAGRVRGLQVHLEDLVRPGRGAQPLTHVHQHGVREPIPALQPAALWVPETLRTSCDLLILVEQSTESVTPSDAFSLARRGLGDWS